MTAAETTIQPDFTYRWRVVDIVIAAVLSVAVGLIFYGWNTIGYAGYEAVNALTPGLGGLVNGVWFMGGPLGAIIIRKPGAAMFVELLAASVSAALGTVWGIETLYSGFAQGLGAELIFLLVIYRRFNLTLTMISGALAGVGAVVLEYFLGNIAKGLEYNLIYLATSTISGAILGGLLAWVLMRALAQTGALSRFAAGREAQSSI